MPLPATSATTSARRLARERDPVVGVAADLVARAASAGHLEARQLAAGAAGSRLSWISRATCSSRSWRCFSSRTRCRRTFSIAARAWRASVAATSRSSSENGSPGGALADREHPFHALRRPTGGTASASRASSRRRRSGPVRQLGDGGRRREAVERGPRLGRRDRPRSPAARRSPRALGERQPVRRRARYRARARDDEVPHHRREDGSDDGLLGVASRQVPAGVEQAVERERLGRQRPGEPSGARPRRLIERPTAAGRAPRGRPRAAAPRALHGRSARAATTPGFHHARALAGGPRPVLRI